MKQCALLLATIAVLSLTPHGLAADAPAASATAPTQTVGKLTINGAGAYEGEIRDGKANGKGKLTYDDGRKYEGEWSRNKYVGPAAAKPAAGGGLDQPSAVSKPGSAHPGAVRAARGVSDPSLVVWYTFDEGSRDSSGNGLHGGIEGTLPWEKGFIGSGAAGCRSGSIRLPDIRDRFANEATLSVWIKMDSGDALGQSIFNFGEGGVEHYPWTDGMICFDVFRNGQVSFKAPAAVDRAKWHHLAVTHKPGPDPWKCYINGTLVCAAAGQDAITLPAGSNLGNGGYGYAAAAFDDFRLYSRALSSNEGQALYGQGVEPVAQAATPPLAGGGTAVLVDEDTVWRHLHLEGPSYFLLDDPAPEVNFGNPEIVQSV